MLRYCALSRVLLLFAVFSMSVPQALAEKKPGKKTGRNAPADDSSQEASDQEGSSAEGKGKRGDRSSGFGISAGFAFESLTFDQSGDVDETGPAFHLLAHKRFPVLNTWTATAMAGLQHAEWGGSREQVTLGQSVTNLDLGANFLYDLTSSLRIGPAIQFLYGLAGTATVEFDGPATGSLQGTKATGDVKSLSRFGYGLGFGWQKSATSLFAFDYLRFNGSMTVKQGSSKGKGDFSGASYRFTYAYSF